ncbi:MAG: hypothetical protein ABI623_09275, partial [bacterium]
VSADSAFAHVRSPYSEVSFAASAGQIVKVIVRVGDTVAIGQVLATIVLAAPIDAEIQLHRNQIQALKGELNQKLSELHSKIEKKSGDVRRDSVVAEKQNELRQKGYSKQYGNTQTYRRARGELRALQSSETTLREKYSLKIQKLNTDILRLQAKQNVLARGESAIRSTVDGIITDIRQSSEGTKRSTTFIIRSLDKKP